MAYGASFNSMQAKYKNLKIMKNCTQWNSGKKSEKSEKVLNAKCVTNTQNIKNANWAEYTIMQTSKTCRIHQNFPTVPKWKITKF